MRSGKRVLAGLAAGALGAGLITFVAAPAAQAGVAASVAWDYPSMTVVATGSTGANDFGALTIPVRMYDAAGDLVSTADDTNNRAVQVTITAPSTADFEDSVAITIGGGSAAIVASSSNAANLAATTVKWATAATDWENLLSSGIDGAGTYTIKATLINTTNGAVLSTSSMPLQVVSGAGAPGANVSFLNGANNPIGNIGVDADDSIANQNLLLTNSTGGRYIILDDSLSFSSATLTLGTDDSANIAGGTLPGIYTFLAGPGNTTGTGGLTKSLSAAVTTTTVVGTGALTYNVGNVDPAASSQVVLTTTPSFDATLTEDTWQVPPGTAKLDFAFNLTNNASTGTIAWNASSNATGGILVPAGGAAAVTVDSGTISLVPNAKASAAGKTVQLTLGAAGSTYRDTVWVVFTDPTATVIPDPGIGKVATATPIPGTITDQYGAALPGTWAIRLLSGSASCSASVTAIATATASATGAFEVTIPAANAPTTAGDATYTVCASNGFATAGTAGNAVVTFTATGGVTSLTAAGYLNGSTLATALPVVQVPGTGIVNVGTLTTQQQTASTALTAATIAASGTAFELQATVSPVTTVAFSGTPGVMFTTQSAGSLSYTAGASTKSVYATAVGTGVSGTSTVYVYATKPGTHTVTVTAGTSTATYTFKAGVARGTIRQIEAIPASITLQPNEFKGTTVKATDIYGNAVPDDSSITASLAGGGTISPVAGSTLTTGADGIVTVYYTAPLGTGKGRILWTAGTYVSGTIPGAPAAVYQTATEIDVTNSGPGSKSIVIVGERATVSGKPGIRVEGETKGFDVGSKMVPSIRFPGQSEYTAGSARPTTSALGDFTWQRKTGKKTYVFFTNEAGDVKSNRVIIPAN